MKHYDFLIVGAGLFGATFAHRATSCGYSCLVVDRRQHTGGNLYCRDIDGINVHWYGAHIFHTSDTEVWRYVNSLVEFNRFTNAPLANYRGRLFNLPFNMNTFRQMWGVTTPQQARDIIDSQRAEAVAAMKEQGISEPANLEQQALMLVGRDIYETLIRDYTEKQWGRPCPQLPAFIIRRLPVRLTYDNNYFNDLYQGIPAGGYNRLIDRMLEKADVMTGTDFFSRRDELEAMADTVVFTGKIDEYFGYRFGRLQYRTVTLKHETLDTPNYQGNAVVNYTDSDTPFTRIIEHKHFYDFGDRVYENPRTVISREYPAEWRDGMEPYYPVNDAANSALYERYRELAEATSGVVFGGRLAEYRYYDMAPVIRSAFTKFEDYVSKL